MAKSQAKLLEKAIILAAEAHKGQVDKAGRPYILHHLRMMAKMKTDSEMIAALLHDVAEDMPWTMTRLRKEGFPSEVLKAIRCLTKRKGEDYMDFVARAASNPIARKVKIADLEDNMDVRRISNFTPRDGERIAKYTRAWNWLVSLEDS
jgi:(p)ppGpp synthase/HD superfamily hydrolase